LFAFYYARFAFFQNPILVITICYFITIVKSSWTWNIYQRLILRNYVVSKKSSNNWRHYHQSDLLLHTLCFVLIYFSYSSFIMLCTISLREASSDANKTAISRFCFVAISIRIIYLLFVKKISFRFCFYHYYCCYW